MSSSDTTKEVEQARIASMVADMGGRSREEAALGGIGQAIKDVNDATAQLLKAFERYEERRLSTGDTGEKIANVIAVMHPVAESAYAKWKHPAATKEGEPGEEQIGWPTREITEEPVVFDGEEPDG